MQGVRMDVIKSGTLKGAGIPGTSLSDAQRADLQAQVGTLGPDIQAAADKLAESVGKFDGILNPPPGEVVPPVAPSSAP